MLVLITGGRRLASLAVFAWLVSSAAVAAPSALIVGRVVDEGDRPLPGTIVTLHGAGPDARVLVDSQGRFVFRNVPAGSVTLTAEHDGCTQGEFGKTRFDGRGKSLDLADGQRVIDLTIKVWHFGSISGRVVDEAGEPVADANVEFFSRHFTAGHWLREGRSIAVTDDLGRFRSGPEPPGNYTIEFASRSITYPTAFAGAIAQAKVAGATAEARVTSELTTKGSVQLGVSPELPTNRVDDFLFVTQARGSLAAIRGGSVTIFPTTFFPSATDPSGSSGFDLAAGEDRTGVDITVRAVPAARVSGVVVGPDGPIANLGLRMQFTAADEFAAQSILEVADTVTTSTGEFTFLGVPPGAYTIWALTSPADALTGGADAGLWGRAAIVVGTTDVGDVRVSLLPRARIRGRLVFEGTTPPPAPARLSALAIQIEPDSGRTLGPFGVTSAGRVAAFDAQGQFVTNGLFPGRYFLRVSSPPPGWTLKSVVVPGRSAGPAAPIDVGDDPIDDVVMTLTDQPIAISGSVHQPSGSGSTVVLAFPADRGGWTAYGATPAALKAAAAGSNGRYAISGIPPGDYFVVAIDEAAMPDAWQDPVFLERLARVAKRITLDRNVALDLTVADLR